MISPLSKSGVNCSIKLSTAKPAFTIKTTFLGFSRLSTNSCNEYFPSTFLCGCSSSILSTTDVVLLNTATVYPLSAIFNARLLPITDNPITPIFCFIKLNLLVFLIINYTIKYIHYANTFT